MSGKKKTKADDQPEKDIFDEDEEKGDTPPRLPDEDESGSILEGPLDASEKPQDAPGQPEGKGKVESPKATPKPQESSPEAEPILGDSERSSETIEGLTFHGKPVSVNSPAFQNFLKAMATEASGDQPRGAAKKAGALQGRKLSEVKGFKVTRGMVGIHAEGTMVPSLQKLGIQEADLERLVEAGVVEPVFDEGK